MIGAPWFLLAVGIVIVLIGSLMAAVSGGRGGFIHANMRDDDIIEELDNAQRMPLSRYVIGAGVLCVFVSVCWRLARSFGL